MVEATLAVVGLAGLVLTAIAVRRAIITRQMQRRLLADVASPRTNEPVGPRLPHASTLLRRYRIAVLVAGVVVAAVVYFVADWGWVFALALGMMATLLAWQVESWLLQRRIEIIEQQLADAVDLMVSGLRAGAGVVSALDYALVDCRRPLEPQLGELIGRIRLGEDPQTALDALVERVPLEPFRLFALTLAVHWEVGGSLAPTLATVGRVIRDRIELSRRLRSLTAHARVSVLAIMGVTYFIALVGWRTDPQRMADFLATQVGQGSVAAAMLLQCVGIVWITHLSRVKL